jgi:hypothetical protein
MSPSPGQTLTRDIEVRGVEVLPWGQRHVTTVLHVPVLAMAEVARSARAQEKKGGKETEVWRLDYGGMREACQLTRWEAHLVSIGEDQQP